MKKLLLFLLLIQLSPFSQVKNVTMPEYKRSRKPFITFAIAEYTRKATSFKKEQEMFFTELLNNLKDVTSDEKCSIMPIEQKLLSEITHLTISKKDEFRIYLPKSANICKNGHCPEVILFIKNLSFTEKEEAKKKYVVTSSSAGKVVTEDRIKPSAYYVYWDNQAKSVISYGIVTGKTVPLVTRSGFTNTKGVAKAIKAVARKIINNTPF
jgi:hypothetical protein